MASILVAFGLPADFNLNSFANWLPACARCNNVKRGRVFAPVPLIRIELDKAVEKAAMAAELSLEVVQNQTVTKAVNTLKRAQAAGKMRAAIIEELRPLVAFHQQKRSPETIGKPVRLTPFFTLVGENVASVREMLLSEIKHRVSILLLLLLSPFTWTQLHTVRAAISGHTEGVNPSRVRHSFAPLFAETSAKGLHALIWDYSQIVPDGAAMLALALEGSKTLLGFTDEDRVMALVSPRGFSDSTWVLLPEYSVAYQKVLDALCAVGLGSEVTAGES